MFYVALQENVSARVLPGWIEKYGIQQWLYLGEDSAWRLQAEAVVSCRVPRLSVADELDRTAWYLRRSFIDWIGGLSQINASLEWWGTELAAKNPYHFLFLRICLLSVGRGLIAAGFGRPTLVICSTRALFQEICEFASEEGRKFQQLYNFPEKGFQYLRGAYRKLRRFKNRFDSQVVFRRDLLGKKGVGREKPFAGAKTGLVFSWIDRRNFGKNGSFRDLHLGPLLQTLRDRGFHLGIVPMVLDTISFSDAVDALTASGESFFFPELYLSEKDLKDCRRRAEEFDPVFGGDLISGIPGQRLARECMSKTRYLLPNLLAYESLISGFSASGIRPQYIFHPCEGHSWEQVLTWSVRKYFPGTKTVGVDAGVFSRLVLSMYPAFSEVKLRPLPDLLVTHGPSYQDTLIAEGFPSESTISGCALRHANIWEKKVRANNITLSTHPIRVLVAPGIDFVDSVELTAKAIQAFGDERKYQIVVKCHPLVDVNQVEALLQRLLPPVCNIEFVNSSIGDLLSNAQILLYTYTSVCFEALQHGVLPVFVRSENFLNLDKLEGVTDVRWIATTPEDMCKVAEEITKMSPQAYSDWRRRASKAVMASLAPITSQALDAIVDTCTELISPVD